MTASFLLLALAVLITPAPDPLTRTRQLLATLTPAARPGGSSAQAASRLSRAAGTSRPAGAFRSARGRTSALGGFAAGVIVAAGIGGWAGLATGAVGGVLATRLLSRLEPAASRRLRVRRQAELPDAVELLATALGAGLPLSGALLAVADATGGALAPDLRRVGELCRLGAGPATAWADYTEDPVLRPVARAAHRSADSGAALAASLSLLAADHRADALLRAEAAARRAGVLAMAPLGLCFLPAFICLGVVPVVIGLAATVLP